MADDARATLRRFGFIETFYPIEPGTLVIGNGEASRFRPLTDSDELCVGLALDRPRTTDGFMWPTDVAGTPRATGGMGEYWEVPYPNKIPTDPRERERVQAHWTALALARLLERFDADTQHEQTGYLGDSEENVRAAAWERPNEPDRAWRWIRGRDCPRGTEPIPTRYGVYASHSARPRNEGDGDPDPRGQAGPLTLAGQIVCLGAVLADRLSGLAHDNANPALVAGVVHVAGCPDPLNWTDEDRTMFKRALGELKAWRFGRPDLVAAARTDYETTVRETEAALMADPEFRARVEAGKRFEDARAAATEAARSYREERDRLIAANVGGYPPGAQVGRDIDALNAKALAVELETFERHGFPRRTPPTSPSELGERLARVVLSKWFDLDELTTFPTRPSDRWWSDAEGLRRANPLLPELPPKPEAGRERWGALVKWCASCVGTGGVPERAEVGAVPTPPVRPGPTVVLWEGAAATRRNIALARSRTAYLEAHGDVEAARAALKAEGFEVGRSTFYDHLNALDEECPGWRTAFLLSGSTGIPEDGVTTRSRGKRRGKPR